ncbi:hypothetical protein BCR43DRAFT_497121 [Syncephalastrum racemosum]|uniref:Uncharacterized protein n=1 Tax=Syncephalastrum racemosum TaxID=13706 RepID=A0A1X2H579_SYNRA|nr:hypothetical protein BCR43DRAFT_497121 [Syncephalastrum racemosum]
MPGAHCTMDIVVLYGCAGGDTTTRIYHALSLSLSISSFSSCLIETLSITVCILSLFRTHTHVMYTRTTLYLSLFHTHTYTQFDRAHPIGDQIYEILFWKKGNLRIEGG